MKKETKQNQKKKKKEKENKKEKHYLVQPPIQCKCHHQHRKKRFWTPTHVLPNKQQAAQKEY